MLLGCVFSESVPRKLASCESDFPGWTGKGSEIGPKLIKYLTSAPATSFGFGAWKHGIGRIFEAHWMGLLLGHSPVAVQPSRDIGL
jgi:hypothetical protein